MYLLRSFLILSRSEALDYFLASIILDPKLEAIVRNNQDFLLFTVYLLYSEIPIQYIQNCQATVGRTFWM